MGKRDLNNVDYTTEAGGSKSIDGSRPSHGIARQMVVSTAATNIPKVNFHGGMVLRNVRVEEIFWGLWWTTNVPFIKEVNQAVGTILTSPYMTELRQYGGIGRGRLGDIRVVYSPIGTSPADPPPIFERDDIQTLVSNLIESKLVPDPQTDDQLLYSVFLPFGCKNNDPNAAAEHWVFPMGSTKVHYAWITNDGGLHGLNSIPKLFSHELVEACTDPDFDAYYHDPNPTAEEIADLTEELVGTVNGVTMQYYWSERERRPVLPDQFSLT